MKLKGFHVGALKLNARVTAFIVTWNLTPRGSNHVVLTKEDLILIYCMMKNIKVIWIHVFKEHMQKSMRLSYYHFPYVVFMSKFLQYFEIDLDEELSQVVKPSHEINNWSLSKMGFIKVDNKWVSIEEEQMGLFLEDQAEPHDGHQVKPNARNQVGPNQAKQGTGNQTSKMVVQIMKLVQVLELQNIYALHALDDQPLG